MPNTASPWLTARLLNSTTPRPSPRAPLEPGWRPSHKLLLFRTEDCRPTGKNDPAPVPVAVAYKVSMRLMGERTDRFVRELPNGQVLVSERYEDVFQGMLDEPHPTRTLEVRGQRIPVRRYQMYWSALELYDPQTAEELAASRVNRETRQSRAGRGRTAARESAVYDLGGEKPRGRKGSIALSVTTPPPV